MKVLPITWYAITFWTSLSLFYEFSELLYCKEGIITTILLLFTLFLIASKIKKSAGKTYYYHAIICLIFVLIAYMLGLFTAYQYESGQHNISEDENVECVLELLSDSRESEYGSSAEVKVFIPSLNQSFKAKAYFKETESLYCGDTYKVKARIDLPKARQKEHFWKNGIVASLDVCECESYQEDIFELVQFNELRKRFIESFSNAASENESFLLIAALSCGYTNKLYDSGVYKDAKSLGLAHLIAISGAHLSVICSTIMFALRMLKIGRIATIIIQIVFLALYVCVAAYPISALRAALMCVASLTGFFVKRRSMSQNTLALCVLCFLMTDPYCVNSLALLLSASSTLGITLAQNNIEEKICSHAKCKKNPITASLSMSLAATVFTVPFTVANFSCFSPLFLFSNILASLPFSVLCVCSLLSLVFSFVWAPLEFSLLGLCMLLCDVIAKLLSVFNMIPFSHINLYLDERVASIVFIGILIFFALPSIKRVWIYKSVIIGTVFAGFISSGLSNYAVQPRLAMLNVGQGDAFLLQYRGQNILVDTGENVNLLHSELARLGVQKLDYVYITHSDKDHCGALASISHMIPIETVVFSDIVDNCKCNNCKQLLVDAQETHANIVYVSPGDTLENLAMKVKVVWPYELKDRGGNEDSLSLCVQIVTTKDNCFNVLLCGDASVDTIQSMCEMADVDNIDILKLGHHGSKGSTDKELLLELNPSLALISVGEYNSYGHPHEEVLAALQACNVEYVRSDQEGSVLCLFKNSGIKLAYMN